MKDPIVEKVRNDLYTRSQTGIKKYGTTLAGNKGDHLYWLQHAYEEALDMALYLKRAMEEGREGCVYLVTNETDRKVESAWSNFEQAKKECQKWEKMNPQKKFMVVELPVRGN
jgi:outer membrane protease